MDVLKFFKRQVLAPTLRPLQLVAKQAGASILIIGDDQSEKVKTFLAEITTPFGTVAPTYVITTQPHLWVNRPQTMVLGIAPKSASSVHYLEMVDKLSCALDETTAAPHVLVVIDSSEHLGKMLKDVIGRVKRPNVELVVFREHLTKAMSDQSNVRLFERVAIFRSHNDTLAFLKKHKYVQNTLIWFNAKDAKPGKYWIV